MHRSFLFVWLLALVPSIAPAKSDIRITGGKDLVVTIDSREEVLAAGARYLSKGNPEFLAMIADLDNPFSFEQVEDVPEPSQVADDRPREPRSAPVAAPVNYDDATILNAISASLARQVRGTIARGNTRYMQLAGGGLLKAGTTLPARLPQLEGQTFNVTVTEVTADGYSLKLNEATLYVPFSDRPLNSSSSITRSPE